jgi:hypothetical protein
LIQYAKQSCKYAGLLQHLANMQQGARNDLIEHSALRRNVMEANPQISQQQAAEV